MADLLRSEYAAKYVRDGVDCFPDFSDLGLTADSRYVCEPCDITRLAESTSERYITFLGGDMTSALELHARVEFMLGATIADMRKYTFTRAVSARIEPGMLYSVRVAVVDDPKTPPLYNELVFGEKICPDAEPRGDYDYCFKSGEEVCNLFHPYREVTYPCVVSTNGMFGSHRPLRRCWMPVSGPLELGEEAHAHEFDQYLIFTGSNPENPLDLGGVVEFTLGEAGQPPVKYSVSHATQFFVKKGLVHSPLSFKQIDDPKYPILFCETSFTDSYGGAERRV
ncbi:MAG: hypothetical protein LBN99_02845 [Oscillospiraceae bacterium]|jgi:hypothetical protein|nr:hypothetical protein [Oscillospiraceae bacterium]